MPGKKWKFFWKYLKKKSTSIFDLFFMAYFNIESVLVSAKSE